MGCISILQKMKTEGGPSQDVKSERRILGTFPAQDQQMMKSDRLAGIISPILGACLMQSATTGLSHCLVLKTPTPHTPPPVLETEELSTAVNICSLKFSSLNFQDSY